MHPPSSSFGSLGGSWGLRGTAGKGVKDGETRRIGVLDHTKATLVHKTTLKNLEKDIDLIGSSSKHGQP